MSKSWLIFEIACNLLSCYSKLNIFLIENLINILKSYGPILFLENFLYLIKFKNILIIIYNKLKHSKTEFIRNKKQ